MPRSYFKAESELPHEIGRPIEIVTGQLFTGNRSILRFPAYFTRCGINALLSVAEEAPDVSSIGHLLFEVRHLPMNDRYFIGNADFQLTADCLAEMISNHGVVMVACTIGLNRSVCASASFLMMKARLNPIDALIEIEQRYKQAGFRIKPFVDLQDLLWKWWESWPDSQSNILAKLDV